MGASGKTWCIQSTTRSAPAYATSQSCTMATFGLPLPEAMIALSGKPELVETMRDAYREYNNAHHDDMIRPIPGVKETLEQLKAQGIKLALVTSKKPPMLRRGLDCLQLTQYFDATVALGDTKESKPHPEPMLAACVKLGVKPEECLCVGDSPFDLQSGRSAGAQTVAVRYTAFGWEKLVEEGRPDFVIARPQELLEIVEK